MGRVKGFDPDAALGSALELFWRKGYEATSMQELVDAMGIGRASIYATFGDKHELYLAALNRYRERSGEDTLRGLAVSGSALEAVRAQIWAFAEKALADPDRKGCLVTNTAAECLPGDGEVATVVGSSLADLENAFAGALYRAHAAGELKEAADPRALARLLVTLIQGVKVTAKMPDPERVRASVEQALRLLD